MAFALSILFIAVTLLPIVAILNPQKNSSRILALYLLGYSLLVFNAEISGFVGLLDKQWFFLLLQGIECATAWLLWWRRGKPSLRGVVHFQALAHLLFAFWQNIRKNPWIAALTTLVSAGYGVLAWLILNVPPNNSDSMHTHLARVVYWLQQGSFKQLTSYSIYAKIYPFDAQLNVLWTILFTRSDKYVGFIQFFAAIATAIAIYGLARFLKASGKFALLVSLIWLMFPLIAFQATSTQFDLVVTALFTSSMYFFFDFIRNKGKVALFFSGLAMGLALGTKETIFMMGPAVLVIAIILLVKDRLNFTWLWKWAVVTLVAFLVLGSYTYFNNLHYYGNPLGPAEHVQADSTGNASFAEKLTYNPPRFLYQFISFDSLPTEIADPANEFKNYLFTSLNDRLNLDLESLKATKDPTRGFSLNETPNFNEDESWFGVASWILLIPAFIAGIVVGVKKRDLLSISLVLSAISFFFCEMWLRPGWDPYQGRYFIMGVTGVAPLSVHLFKRNVFSSLFQFMIAIVALLTFAMAVFSNESKPILGYKMLDDLYTAKYLEYTAGSSTPGLLQKLNLKILFEARLNVPFLKSIDEYSDTELRTLSSMNLHTEIVEALNKNVPEDATIGIMLVNGDFDYVFFGPQLSRRLINIVPEVELYSQEWLQNHKISYVLIAQVNRFPEIPAYLQVIAEVKNWGLYRFTPSP